MFGVDFTWVGWIWIGLAIFNVIINTFKCLLGIEDRTGPGVMGFAAVLGLLMIVGFFTVGFVE